jgi:hypothetical protein
MYTMEPRIKLPIPYKQTEKNLKSFKKIDNKLKELNKVGSEKTLHFFGSDDVEAMFYLYLFKKYKSNCFLHDKNGGRSLGISIRIKDDYTPVENEEIMTHFEILTKSLVDCIMNVESKIIIIPLQLRLPSSSGHANVLIYRKQFNQIEHFEPHGRYYKTRDPMNNHNRTIERWLTLFVSELNKKLRIINQPDVNFINSNEVCPRMDGLQNLESWSTLAKIADVEPSGYCAAWSLFFTELSLKNPEIPSSELLNYIYVILEKMDNAKKSNYLREVIRGYAVFVNEKINKYFSVFFKMGITIQKLKTFSRTDKYNFRKILENLINLEINLSTDPSYIKNDLIETQRMLTEVSKKLSLGSKGGMLVDDFIKLVDKKKMYEVYDNFIISEQSRSLSTSKPPQLPQSEPQVSVKQAAPVSVKQVSVKQAAPVSVKQVSVKQAAPVSVKQVSVKQAAPVSVKQVYVKQTKPCPEGKEINPATGRCIKIKTQKVRIQKETEIKPKQVKQNVEIKSTKPCPEGKEINPATGRCIKIKTVAKTIKQNVEIKPTKPCPEGKEINPATGMY